MRTVSPISDKRRGLTSLHDSQVANEYIDYLAGKGHMSEDSLQMFADLSWLKTVPRCFLWVV